MISSSTTDRAWGRPPGRERDGRAFTIIELLVVVSIIALLIGILVPSLSGARDQAKNVKTRAMLNAITTSLEMFRGENEKQFRASNGYPPSERGEDLNDAESISHSPVETMYGAHWLVRYLMGFDLKGFVPARAVPPSLVNAPDQWYSPTALNGTDPLDRVGPYLDPDSVEVVATKDLPGKPNEDTIDTTLVAPVIADVFGRPILYYVANPFGKALAALTRDGLSDGTKGVFAHEDNYGFTGSDGDSAGGSGLTAAAGWIFGNGDHRLAKFGSPLPADIDDDANIGSFCHYLVDKNLLAQSSQGGAVPDDQRTVRPYRADSFLLITPGKDGIYGTPDDISNIDQLRE